jgi:exosortase J
MLIVPASLVLVLRVWRQRGWELQGTWWGLLPVSLAFFSIIYSWNLIFNLGAGPLAVHFLPAVLPLYLYAGGVILLFAGTRVWRQAWFPLALLLCVQPVPAVASHLLDLPLQSLSAHIARSFATLIGFPPTNPELLKLMFTPDFGMFIAPGCDGMRGAVTLGYVALIVGYLKRVPILRWIIYVSGAVLLGHLFNLLRLCALVLYYRVAAGHPALENIAKQADYAIGGCLFLVAAVLFIWVVLRKEDNEKAMDDLSMPSATASTGMQRLIYWKVAAFAILALIAAVPGVHAILLYRASLAASIRSGALTSKELDDRLPKQIGDYRLTRAWQEQTEGVTAMEEAAYKTATSNEITLGIWLRQSGHNIHDSWMIHGRSPEMRADRSFVTAQGRIVYFDTAFYSDGVTDSFGGNASCTPSYCLSSLDNKGGLHIGLTKAADFTTRGVRLVPISFRVEMLHTDAPKAVIYKELSAECQSFLSGVDFTELSQNYQ